MEIRGRQNPCTDRLEQPERADADDVGRVDPLVAFALGQPVGEGRLERLGLLGRRLLRPHVGVRLLDENGDLLRLFAESRIVYTPTILVAYGGPWSENYWYQHTNVYEHERLLRYVPRETVDARSRRRTMTSVPQGVESGP